MRTAVTLEGDTIERVCWRELGTTAGGVVEMALSLNAEANLLGEELPAGLQLYLPEPPAAKSRRLRIVNLWD